MEKQDGFRKELLLAEFGEAWTHYRHIESNRQQYLNLYFGFLAGIFGLLLTMSPNMDFKNITSVVGISGLCWILSVFASLLYSNVRKMKYVLRGYEEAIAFVRRLAYDKDYDYYFSQISVRSIRDPIMSMKIFSVQWVSEFFFAFFALIFAIALICITAVAWPTINLTIRIALLSGIATSLGLILYSILAPTVFRRRLANKSD